MPKMNKTPKAWQNGKKIDKTWQNAKDKKITKIKDPKNAKQS